MKKSQITPEIKNKLRYTKKIKHNDLIYDLRNYACETPEGLEKKIHIQHVLETVLRMARTNKWAMDWETWLANELHEYYHGEKDNEKET